MYDFKRRSSSTLLEDFVKGLDGRYKKFVSDEFLVLLLRELLAKAFTEVDPTSEEEVYLSKYYEVGCVVFESILEIGCKADGNGHHVSQHFVDYIRKLLKLTGPDE